MYGCGGWGGMNSGCVQDESNDLDFDTSHIFQLFNMQTEFIEKI